MDKRRAFYNRLRVDPTHFYRFSRFFTMQAVRFFKNFASAQKMKASCRNVMCCFILCKKTALWRFSIHYLLFRLYAQSIIAAPPIIIGKESNCPRVIKSAAVLTFGSKSRTYSTKKRNTP